jgi:glycerol transport system permease protein
MIAILLRFMDSFMIYTEPFVVTGGGPGNSTNFLSIDLVKHGLGQFDLGPAAAYLDHVLPGDPADCWVFFTVMTNLDKRQGWRLSGKWREPWRVMMPIEKQLVVMALYLLFLMLPIYWLINMSLKTNQEILSADALPGGADLPITHDPHRSELVPGLHQLADLCDAEHGDQPRRRVAGSLRFQPLPFPGRQASVLLAADQPDGAARGFRAALLPALLGSVGLFDTHIAVALAHTLFNVPLAVWILEGFMRGVPKEIDETAYIDGYSFPTFFVKIFMPLIARHRCRRLLLLHVLVGGTAAFAHADHDRRQADRRHHDPHGGRPGIDWGVLAAAGVLTIVPGRW